MSGNHRFLLDTNAVVSLLAGNRKLAALLDDANYVGISVISYLEFLAFEGLSDNDRACFASFCERIEIVALSHEENEMIDQILDLRKDYRLKLPRCHHWRHRSFTQRPSYHQRFPFFRCYASHCAGLLN